MSREEWIVAVIVAAKLAIVAGLLMSAGRAADRDEANFRPACTASGGTPVFDGRQWQCLMPQGGAR